MTYLQRDREQLARKVRLLVHRAHKRAQGRQLLRDMGVDVPEPEPDSWEAFEDRVYQMFKRADERADTNLAVLPERSA